MQNFHSSGLSILASTKSNKPADKQNTLQNNPLPVAAVDSFFYIYQQRLIGFPHVNRMSQLIVEQELHW